MKKRQGPSLEGPTVKQLPNAARAPNADERNNTHDGTAGAALPIDNENANDAPSADATTAPLRRTSFNDKKRSTTLKDHRLGPRLSDATHWRCRRLEDDNVRKGTILLWSESDDGIEIAEWPIKSCSPETIRERWGAGRYIVDYMHIDDRGKRKPRGRSRVLHVTAARKNESPSKLSEAVAVEPSLAPAMAAPTPTVTPPITMDPTNPAFTQLFSLLAYMQDRDEKARAAAAAEARYMITRTETEAKVAIARAENESKAAQERAIAEIKAAHERYRTDLEFQLERERLASKERCTQIEAQARQAPARGGSRFDPEELLNRVSAIGERVDDALARIEESAPDSEWPEESASPDKSTAAILRELKDLLRPAVPVILAKLAGGATLQPAPGAPSADAPASDPEASPSGDGSGGEPEGQAA
jgi:hypothetical protein